MMRQFSIIILLLYFLSIAAKVGFTQEVKDEELIQFIEKMTGIKTGSVQPPEHLKILKKVRPFEAFRYFSGYYRSLNNNPVIYVTQTKNNEYLVVVGPNYEKQFPIHEFEQAVKAYLQLLLAQGYHPTYYTIFVGSFKNKIDAQKYAKLFRDKGFEVDIIKIDLPQKGTWYRVYVEKFLSLLEAKQFINLLKDSKLIKKAYVKCIY